MAKRYFGISGSRPQGGVSYISGTSSLPLLGEHTSQQLRRIASKFKDNLAVISHHQQLKYTYQELDQRTTEVALKLISLGLQKGDRVGIYSPNNAEWTLMQMACARASLVLVNVNPAFQSDELAYCLNKVGVRALVMADQFKKSNYINILRQALHIGNESSVFKSSKIPSLQNVILLSDHKVKGLTSWSDFINIPSNSLRDEIVEREKSITYEDVANIQFTSGTTGFPKAVTLSHHNILNNAQYIAQVLELTSDDKICIPVPLYHCFGMVIGNLTCMNQGSTMVYPNSSFDPVSSLQAVESYQCTGLYGVPTMFTAVLAEQEKSKYNVKTLRTGVMAGSVCPEPLVKKVYSELNMHGFSIIYGMTELSPMTTIMGPNVPFEKKTTTVGHCGPMTEIKLIDENGNIVPVGQKGEVCVRGYLTMLRYWEDPGKTAETLRNGWIHSGDIGQIDEDGFLSIVGRSKDMIIRGGENISPFEIETFFDKRKWVRDIQVIGVKDENYVEEVAAWIIPDREVSDPKQLVDELLEMVDGRLAHFKLPRYIYLCEGFPLTVTGKVKKNEIRDQMNQLIESGSPKVLKFSPSKNKK